jgi:hypothetical protein
VPPGWFQFPKGESALVEAFEDKKRGDEYGFIQVTIQQVTIQNRMLTCAFYEASGTAGDKFTLDLDQHQYAAS